MLNMDFAFSVKWWGTRHYALLDCFGVRSCWKACVHPDFYQESSVYVLTTYISALAWMKMRFGGLEKYCTEMTRRRIEDMICWLGQLTANLSFLQDTNVNCMPTILSLKLLQFVCLFIFLWWTDLRWAKPRESKISAQQICDEPDLCCKSSVTKGICPTKELVINQACDESTCVECPKTATTPVGDENLGRSTQAPITIPEASLASPPTNTLGFTIDISSSLFYHHTRAFRFNLTNIKIPRINLDAPIIKRHSSSPLTKVKLHPHLQSPIRKRTFRSTDKQMSNVPQNRSMASITITNSRMEISVTDMQKLAQTAHLRDLHISVVEKGRGGQW